MSTTNFSDYGLMLQNYLCFGDDWQGIERIKPINVIVGRNNSGKSSVIDLVETLCSLKEPIELNGGQRRNLPVHEHESACLVVHDFNLPHLKQESASNRKRNPPSPQQKTQQREEDDLIDRHTETRIYWQPGYALTSGDTRTTYNPRVFEVRSPDPRKVIHQEGAAVMNFKTVVARRLRNPLANITFRRVGSERDIRPERDSDELTVAANGTGVTNLLQRFIHDNELPHQKVTEEVLGALNEIVLTDEQYTEITAQRIRGGQNGESWEVYLTSGLAGDRRIALSESGSGLKTILIVLANIFLIPHVEKTQLEDYFFAFEELENNLHPALQRRLFTFLKKFAAEHRCHFFFTTHSPVVIDLFSDYPDAQLLHVTRDSDTGAASVKTVDTYKDSCHILDDLEARASDLLQANGIVWVEGPSDRIYFNKWVNLWSDRELQDGVHYQCLTFGGSIATHFKAEPPDDERVDALINILKINRNLIFITDSDKENEGQELKAHVKRLKRELEEIDSLCWITAGKEVENYIPPEAIPRAFANEKLEGSAEERRYENNVEAVRAFQNKSSLSKVALAHKIAAVLKKEMIAKTLDLPQRLDATCAEIRRWNGL